MSPVGAAGADFAFDLMTRFGLAAIGRRLDTTRLGLEGFVAGFPVAPDVEDCARDASCEDAAGNCAETATTKSDSIATSTNGLSNPTILDSSVEPRIAVNYSVEAHNLFFRPMGRLSRLSTGSVIVSELRSACTSMRQNSFLRSKYFLQVNIPRGAQRGR